MSLWEYKVISSGKGGFATPALLEKFLNDLGRDEWEIIEFRTAQDNALAFSGLARRTTQRDWTLQDAAAAAAKAEAEKLRAEFEAKFKAATTSGPATGGGEERSPSFLEEKAAPDDGLRKLVDTSQDGEPEPAEEEEDEWDKLTAAETEELPTFFEAIKPHMRRNQRGPGMSVGVDYLAKKWDQSEEDLTGALVECGFVMPEDEDSKAEYVEYDGDLYWLNINRRGELWINTKEKPRPVFRAVKAQRAVVEEEPKPEKQDRGQRHERGDRGQKSEKSEKPESSGEAKPETEGGAQPTESGGEAAAGGAEATAASGEAPAAGAEGQASGGGGGGKPQGPELPQGPALLAKIRPHMRRNRRGPGGSGSASFLARALRRSEADIKDAFVALGLTVPTSPNDKAVYTEFGEELWWLNLDSRGGLWINGREKKRGETLAGANAAPAEAAAAGSGENAAPATTEAAAAGDAAAPVAPVSADVAPASAPMTTEPSSATGVASDSASKPEAEASASISEPVADVPAPAAVSAPAPMEPTPAPAPSESERQREAAPQPAVTPVVAPAEPAPVAETKSEPAAPAAGESAAVAEDGTAKDEGESAGKSDDEAEGSPEKEKKPRRPRTKKKAE